MGKDFPVLEQSAGRSFPNTAARSPTNDRGRFSPSSPGPQSVRLKLRPGLKGLIQNQLSHRRAHRCYCFLPLRAFQRASAALRALSRLSSAVKLAARALPPPRRPRETAAGVFFRSSLRTFCLSIPGLLAYSFTLCVALRTMS